MEHDWHPFDVERGYDVRQVHEDRWELRDKDGRTWELNAEEFEQLRSTGENPKDIP